MSPRTPFASGTTAPPSKPPSSMPAPSPTASWARPTARRATTPQARKVRSSRWTSPCWASCLGLNGGPAFPHTEAFSFQVATDDQAETDRYWNAILEAGGQPSACGWCKDKWGLNWQITPRALMQAIAHPDPAAAKRAFNAMMEMTKIDIAAIEAAVKG